MAVAAEDLDGRLGVHAADGIEDDFEGAGVVGLADGVVAEEDKHVDGLLAGESLGEPALLDHVLCLEHLRSIRVAWPSPC